MILNIMSVRIILIILGGNGDKAAVDKLLVEGCRVDEKGRKRPGEAGGPERVSWDETCFCVCQPDAEEEGWCCCCCWWRRSFRTCFSLCEKSMQNILNYVLLYTNKVGHLHIWMSSPLYIVLLPSKLGVTLVKLVHDEVDLWWWYVVGQHAELTSQQSL